jgi:hypothetical protein
MENYFDCDYVLEILENFTNEELREIEEISQQLGE